MYPELLKIGPVTIYSYGLMLGIAFLLANILITRELKRLKLDVSLATGVTMLALIGGVAGAKLFHVLESWDSFIADPAGTVFSSGGLTWYGGFIFALILIYIFLRKKKFSLMKFADIASPSLAIGYGIGRVGCQLAGDGDYGIPTDGPWAMSYPDGTVSTLADRNPDLVRRFTEIFPDTPVPVDIPVHPTPLYEIVLAIGVFLFLFLRRKRDMPTSNQFGWFLLLHSICRFMVEFIRLNERMVFGLSEAQLISVFLALWGVYLVVRKTSAAAVR